MSLFLFCFGSLFLSDSDFAGNKELWQNLNLDIYSNMRKNFSGDLDGCLLKIQQMLKNNKRHEK